MTPPPRPSTAPASVRSLTSTSHPRLLRTIPRSTSPAPTPLLMDLLKTPMSAPSSSAAVRPHVVSHSLNDLLIPHTNLFRQPSTPNTSISPSDSPPPPSSDPHPQPDDKPPSLPLHTSASSPRLRSRRLPCCAVDLAPGMGQGAARVQRPALDLVGADAEVSHFGLWGAIRHRRSIDRQVADSVQDSE